MSSYRETLFLVCSTAVTVGLVMLWSAPFHTFPLSKILAQLGVLQGRLDCPLRLFQR